MKKQECKNEDPNSGDWLITLLLPALLVLGLLGVFISLFGKIFLGW